jgi:hypothetical protein
VSLALLLWRFFPDEVGDAVDAAGTEVVAVVVLAALAEAEGFNEVSAAVCWGGFNVEAAVISGADPDAGGSGGYGFASLFSCD